LFNIAVDDDTVIDQAPASLKDAVQDYQPQ
jgi:hypothetical protein